MLLLAIHRAGTLAIPLLPPLGHRHVTDDPGHWTVLLEAPLLPFGNLAQLPRLLTECFFKPLTLDQNLE